MYYLVNNIHLFVKDEGKGEPVLLFLHFWGGSSATWSSVTEILKDQFRCISYDHRGWGKSDKPDTGYSIKELAEDALALIAQLNLRNYILVGHSMGGKIGQYIASQRPKGLQKLVLVAPSPALPTILPEDVRQGMANAYTTLEGINTTINEVFQAADLAIERKAQVIRDMQSHSDRSRLGWTEIALLEDVSANLANIKVPVLIIAGEHDLVDTPERLEHEVRSKIPGAEMVTIPGVGHLSMLQQPHLVANYILNFCR